MCCFPPCAGTKVTGPSPSFYPAMGSDGMLVCRRGAVVGLSAAQEPALRNSIHARNAVAAGQTYTRRCDRRSVSWLTLNGWPGAPEDPEHHGAATRRLVADPLQRFFPPLTSTLGTISPLHRAPCTAESSGAASRESLALAQYCGSSHRNNHKSISCSRSVDRRNGLLSRSPGMAS